MAVFRGVYSPEVLDSPLRSTAERATHTLDEFADSHEDEIVWVEWNLTRKGGGPALRLHLKQDNDEFTTAFQPSDLLGEKGWTSMVHSYRQLLRTRTHRMLEKMRTWETSTVPSGED